MLRKVFFGMLTLLLALSLVGCDGGDKPVEPANNKVAADKMVLTYAELLATGESANDVGLSDEEKSELVNFAAQNVIKFCGDPMPVSEKSGQTIGNKIHELSKKNMKFTVTLKNDDPEHPVVELKTTPWTSSGTESKTDYSKKWIDMNVKLHEGGATAEQIRENSEFQDLTIKALTESFDTIVFNTEKTLDITCNEVNGHWAPENVADLYNFLMGMDELKRFLENPEAFKEMITKEMIMNEVDTVTK